jgi:AhpD family alkylhydroperoxidase
VDLRADIELDVGYMHITHLTDLIYLVVSRDNSCRFCYGASRMLMRMAGMSDKRIEQLEQDVETARLDDKSRLALEYARRVSRSNPPPGASERKQLQEAGYDEAAIDELAFFATDVVFHNRFATLLALPPQLAERIARSRLLPLIRLRFRKLLERVSQPAQPEWLPDELKTGPFSDVVNALDGTVQARILRSILDEAWASPHLSPRTKALVFAVIARGLGSVAAEREAYRLLAAEGFDAGAVDDILAHLSSPLLDDVEANVIPYARETIRYQPAPIQRRGSELRERITEEQFIETVGICALANMICRLAIALERGGDA